MSFSLRIQSYVEPDVWECPKCGAPNRPGNGRCWSCGTKETAQHRIISQTNSCAKEFSTLEKVD